jgi:serine/threonine protein kinase
MWSLGCTMYALAFGRSPFESPKSVLFISSLCLISLSPPLPFALPHHREGVLRLAIVNGKYSIPPGNSNMGITFSNEFISLMNVSLPPPPSSLFFTVRRYSSPCCKWITLFALQLKKSKKESKRSWMSKAVTEGESFERKMQGEEEVDSKIYFGFTVWKP